MCFGRPFTIIVVSIKLSLKPVQHCCCVQGKQAELAAIQLPYNFKALEPRIDARTMELHVSTAAAAAAAAAEAAAKSTHKRGMHWKLCTAVGQKCQTQHGQALAHHAYEPLVANQQLWSLVAPAVATAPSHGSHRTARCCTINDDAAATVVYGSRLH
jgi:hypothetical protein